jgi:hypothetical protein
LLIEAQVMSHEVAVSTAEVPATPVEVRPQGLLDQIVEAVRRDSQQSAEEFLAETCVPHGGE